MNESENWRLFALTIVAAGQTMFALLYATFPWWRSFLGRAMFFKSMTLAVLVDVGLTARVYPELMHWDALFATLYLWLAAGVWFQFFAFLRVMVTSKRDDWDKEGHR